MFWPTEYRQYNLYFGANQRAFYDRFQIAGGHNGVDLRVDRVAPYNSAIYAALTGTVIQVAFEDTGYGHHVRILSYGPTGEEVTLIYAHLSVIEVAVGMLINKGDVLGWAGSTGDCMSPHLHFGMRMKDVVSGATSDWLNPRPYLDAGSQN
jgi:murein DD-endopeptidase MepM/ murein hydrolase activator NlpD